MGEAGNELGRSRYEGGFRAEGVGKVEMERKWGFYKKAKRAQRKGNLPALLHCPPIRRPKHAHHTLNAIDKSGYGLKVGWP